MNFHPGFNFCYMVSFQCCQTLQQLLENIPTMFENNLIVESSMVAAMKVFIVFIFDICMYSDNKKMYIFQVSNETCFFSLWALTMIFRSKYENLRFSIFWLWYFLLCCILHFYLRLPVWQWSSLVGSFLYFSQVCLQPLFFLYYR